jgi:hypothetical protein
VDTKAGLDSLGEEKQSLTPVEIRKQRGYCANIFFMTSGFMEIGNGPLELGRP